MSLKVIGVGFGRTGTLSLKLALEAIGFGPCYHMLETVTHPEHDRMWLALARGETNDWGPMLGAYNATVDWPGLMIWKELAASYSDAKLILTLRDADAWYASAQATIFARMEDARRAGTAAADPARLTHMRMIQAVVCERGFGGKLDKASAIARFNAHNNEVRRSVTKERLIVHETGDGWEPLCAALNVPIPPIAYPRANSRSDFAARFPISRRPV